MAIDTNFNRSKPSINSLAQMPDVTPPLTPLIKNVYLEDKNIRVDWLKNADTDLAGYNLFRSSLNDSILKEQVNVRLISKSFDTYLDRRTAQGKSYSYMIEAVDITGNISKISTPFKIVVPSAAITDSISITKANYNAKKKQITVQWDEMKNHEMKGYVVYLKQGKAFKPVSGLIAYTEYKMKREIFEPIEIELRGYTAEGEVIKSNKEILTK